MTNPDLRKAAVLLMSLPDRQAAQLLDKLSPEQAAAVLVAMADIDHFYPGEQEGMIGELAACRRRRGGMAKAVKMLGAMPPPAERRLLGDIASADPDLHHVIRRAIFGADVAEYSTVEAA